MTDKLDCRKLMCPLPLVRISQAMKALSPGDTLEVTAEDPAFDADVRAWCKQMGQRLLSLSKQGTESVAILEKA